MHLRLNRDELAAELGFTCLEQAPPADAPFSSATEETVNSAEVTSAIVNSVIEQRWAQRVAPADGGFRTSDNVSLNATLISLFETTAHETPESVAVIACDCQISYGQLQQRVDQLARQLLSMGIRSGARVGLFVERSIEMVVGALAVLKVGAAYVPLDPTYPADRLVLMCEDADVCLILTQQQLLERVSRHAARVICLDDPAIWSASLTSGDSQTRDWPAITSNQLAYVIYTSGSSGRPKGVMMTHHSVVNTIVDVNARFGIGADDRVLALSSLCFDLSVYDIFGLLACGGAVVIPDPKRFREPAHWVELIDQYQITVWNTVPAFMEMLTRHVSCGAASSRCAALRCVMLSGDWIPVSLPDRIRVIAPQAEVISLGGATECAIWSIFFRVQAVDPNWTSIPYGVPLTNQQVLVLDEDLQLCAPGVTGQLYIGGAGVARGYLNRPELNAERFIVDPHSGCADARLYTTGDLGRYLPDGNIQFLGRMDSQVKLDGFRIELGEIESVFARQPGVAESVVAEHTAERGKTSLIAYLVLKPGARPTDSDLIAGLARSLPRYMIPSRFVRVARLPLNANGKVDRRALLAETARAPALSSGDYAAPRDEIERRLVAIWERGFDVRPIGIHDDFFALGGDSLIAATILAYVDDQFNKYVSLDTLFECRTIESLAELVRSESPYGTVSPLVVLQSGSPGLCLVCVPGGGLWVFRKLLRYLDPATTVLGMLPRGVSGIGMPHERVEDIARYYVAALKSFQHAGPYYLVGYSFGGTVAYEMARRLNAIGDNVALLAMLDAPVGGCVFRAWAFLKRAFLSAKDIEQSRLAAAQGDDRGLNEANGLQVAPGWIYAFQKHLRALGKYKPRAYAGRVTLFRSIIRQPWPKRLFDTATLKWLKLAKGGGEVHLVPGRHDEMFDNGNIEVLAKKLKSCLAMARQASQSAPRRLTALRDNLEGSD